MSNTQAVVIYVSFWVLFCVALYAYMLFYMRRWNRKMAADRGAFNAAMGVTGDAKSGNRSATGVQIPAFMVEGEIGNVRHLKPGDRCWVSMWHFTIIMPGRILAINTFADAKSIRQGEGDSDVLLWRDDDGELHVDWRSKTHLFKSRTHTFESLVGSRTFEDGGYRLIKSAINLPEQS